MWGWSSFSPISTIRASSTPAQMNTVTTSIDSATGGVKIQWSSPNNNGNIITAYKIEILQSDLVTWTEDTTNCNGALPSIVSSLQCIIPMSVLTTIPYSLAFGDLV